jgi:hypothetical protein
MRIINKEHKSSTAAAVCIPERRGEKSVEERNKKKKEKRNPSARSSHVEYVRVCIISSLSLSRRL